MKNPSSLVLGATSTSRISSVLLFKNVYRSFPADCSSWPETTWRSVPDSPHGRSCDECSQSQKTAHFSRWTAFLCRPVSDSAKQSPWMHRRSACLSPCAASHTHWRSNLPLLARPLTSLPRPWWGILQQSEFPPQDHETK